MSQDKLKKENTINVHHSFDWVRPEEALPKDNEFVLVMIADFSTPIYCIYQCDDFYLVNIAFKCNDINLKLKILRKKVLIWRGNFGLKILQ